MVGRKNNAKVCEKCGTKYMGGKYSRLCDECRGEAHTKYPSYGLLKERTTDEILDSFIEKNKTVFPEYETCPNFNQDDLSCVLCGYDEWKFKGCGRKKK